jgi:hypothetical protein
MDFWSPKIWTNQLIKMEEKAPVDLFQISYCDSTWCSMIFYFFCDILFFLNLVKF